MIQTTLADDLQRLIRSDASFDLIFEKLIEYRSCEIPRDDVQRALESRRQDVRSEAEEDRILEILDIVSGFCSKENTVWED